MLEMYVLVLVVSARLRRVDQILRSRRLFACLWLYYTQRHHELEISSDPELFSQSKKVQNKNKKSIF